MFVIRYLYQALCTPLSTLRSSHTNNFTLLWCTVQSSVHIIHGFSRGHTVAKIQDICVQVFSPSCTGTNQIFNAEQIKLWWCFQWIMLPYVCQAWVMESLSIMSILYDPYLHFCYELALETSAKYTYMKSLRVHDLCHAHSLASLQWSGPSDQWMLLPTENCLQCQKWSP